jgi:hypothetical protein
MVSFMARKTETVVTLTDDIDGSKADRTISFAFEGASYEIELSKKNASAFEKAMQPYVVVARKARAGATRGRPASTGGRAQSRSDLSEIREWAKAQGMDVSERGRIAQTVQDAYDAAH